MLLQVQQENMLQKKSRVPKKRAKNWKRLLAPYLFLLPFFLLFIVLTIGPYFYAFGLSFFRYRGYGSATFLGFANYLSVLRYHVFWTELGNTLFYWAAHTFPLTVISFLLACLVRWKLIRGAKFFKPIIFLPNVFAIVAVSLVFQNLFATQYGVINQFFHTTLPWLESASLSRWVVVLLLIWRNLGFWFVVFLAGLTTISPELDEAATIDGATVWQRLRFVTLPLMRPIFFFAFIYDAITSMRLYTEPNVLTAGGSLAQPGAAPVLNLLVTNLNAGNFGESSAVGWLLFLVTIGVAGVIFGLFRLTGEVE